MELFVGGPRGHQRYCRPGRVGVERECDLNLNHLPGYRVLGLERASYRDVVGKDRGRKHHFPSAPWNTAGGLVGTRDFVTGWHFITLSRITPLSRHVCNRLSANPKIALLMA